MRLPRLPVFLVMAGGLSAAVGCGQPPSYMKSNPHKTIRIIERGGYFRRCPVATIDSDKRLYRVGEDISITVKLLAPIEAKYLACYLPISGRFHVKPDGAFRVMRPPRSTASLAWVRLPDDEARRRDRTFTVTINRIFPMTRTGWYTIWWQGAYRTGRLRSGPVRVRIMAEVPREGP